MAKTAPAAGPQPLSLADAQQEVLSLADLHPMIAERAAVLFGSIVEQWKLGLMRPTEKNPHPVAFKAIVEEGATPAAVTIRSPDPELLIVESAVNERGVQLIFTDADVVRYRRYCGDDAGEGSEHYNAGNATWVNLFRWLAIGVQE